jgi:hypothetical protein
MLALSFYIASQAGAPETIQRVKIPRPNVVQAQQIYTASTIIVAPPTGTFITITQTPSPSPTPSDVPSVRKDDASGDIVISMSTSLAARVVDLISMFSHAGCPGSQGLNLNKMKRADGLAGVFCGASGTTYNAQDGGAMAAFALPQLNIDFPWSQADVIRAAAQLASFVAAIPDIPLPTREGMQRAAPIFFAMALQYGVYQININDEIGRTGELRIPKSQFKISPDGSTPKEDSSTRCKQATTSAAAVLVGCTQIGPMGYCSSMTTSTKITSCEADKTAPVSTGTLTLTTEVLPWTPEAVIIGAPAVTTPDPNFTVLPTPSPNESAAYCTVHKKAGGIIFAATNQFSIFGKGFGDKDKDAQKFQDAINKACVTGMDSIKVSNWKYSTGGGLEANGRTFDWQVTGVYGAIGDPISCLTTALKMYGAPESAGCDLN